jgi:PAS domain S-box-containing protein
MDDSLRAQLQATLNMIPAYTWYAAPSGALTFVNERCADYLGLPTDHPLRFGIDTGAAWDSHFPLLHPDDQEGSRRVWSACLRTGDPGEMSLRVRGADGNYRWFLSRAEPLRGNDGTLLYWMGINLDIEERKQAEFYLAEGQRLAHTGSWMFNAAGFEYWSPELFAIHGLDPGRKAPTVAEYMALVHPDDREFVAKAIQKMLTDHIGFDFTKRIVRPDGSIRYVRCVGMPATSAGIFQGFVGTGIDVTEHEELTKALRKVYRDLEERDKKIRRLVDANIVGVLVFNLDGRVIEANDAVLNMLGYNRDDLISGRLRWTELTPPDWRAATERALAQIAAQGTCDVYEKECLRKDGSRVPVLVGAAAIQETTSEYVAFVLELTERKRAEQERERLRQLQAHLGHLNRVTTMGELAAWLAHEIKQPIAAARIDAKVCLRALADDRLDVQAAREAAARLVKDAMSADEIIRRTTALYKKGTTNRERVDVNAVIREMVLLFQQEAGASSISIRANLADGIPDVMADRVQLQQVLMNLLLNGIEAMKDTGGELTITSQPGEGAELLISVSDTGVGLPTENPEQIFDSFVTTKPHGTGMGLAITRSIVESHGGRLWATANPGPGATFVFTLLSDEGAHLASQQP